MGEDTGTSFERGGYMADRAESILGSFDYTDIINEIRHRLRREHIVSDGKELKWETPNHLTPLLNEEGVSDIMVLLTSICQRITALSNIGAKEKDRIYIILRQIGSRLITMLAKNYTEYEIHYPVHITLIYETVMNPLEFALRQPLEEGARVFVWKSMSEATQRVIHEVEDK